MAGRIQDKVAIVAGAAQGIGVGIAERLVAEGSKVVIADRHEDQGEATAARRLVREGRRQPEGRGRCPDPNDARAL